MSNGPSLPSNPSTSRNKQTGRRDQGIKCNTVTGQNYWWSSCKRELHFKSYQSLNQQDCNCKATPLWYLKGMLEVEKVQEAKNQKNNNVSKIRFNPTGNQIEGSKVPCSFSVHICTCFVYVFAHKQARTKMHTHFLVEALVLK